MILTINEVIECKEYLDGKHINKESLFRICYMLAKWYKQEGMSHIEIRDAIFKWGKKHSVFITYNVNGIIYQALEDTQRLRDNVVIKINQTDVGEIKKRFDSKNARLLALALLCYAKANANQNKEFFISSVALSNWLGTNRGNMSSRTLPELINFGYIEKVEPVHGYVWNKKDKEYKYKPWNLKINAPLLNSGGIELIDNNILDLYNSVF